MTLAHLILEGKRAKLERLIEWHIDTIEIMERDLAQEQETLHRLMAEERELEDALQMVAA